MLFRILLALIGGIISVYLFKKASTTLSLTKINVVSYIFYLFFLQTYVGAALAFLGDTKHYTFKYLFDMHSIDIMFISVLITAIFLPGTIIAIYKIFKIDMKERYQTFLQNKTNTDGEKIIFWVVCAIAFVCLSMLIILLVKIGYIPFMKLIKASSNFNYGTERTRISNLTIINSYVKNIFVLSFIPVISFIAFAFSVLTKKLRWIILFFILFGAAVVAKTYNFEKSQVIFYFFIYLIIYSFIKGKISKKIITVFFIISLFFILFLYLKMGFAFSFNNDDFYNGPIGRTIFTQVGTLTYNFDMFPSIFKHLNGQSFPNILLYLFHISGGQLRSSRLLMEFYGSSHVYEGTGGVMNSLFIGESYANFGFIGMFFSIIYIGSILAFFMWIFTKIQKNALNVVLFAVLTSKIALTLHGGFVDFVYNFDTIIIVVLIVSINYFKYFLTKRNNKLKLNK